MENTIASRIERYRVDRKLTQQELADKSGISKGGFLKMLKNNKFPSDVLEAIAKALEVSIINLVADIDVNKETLKKLSRDLDELSTQL